MMVYQVVDKYGRVRATFHDDFDAQDYIDHGKFLRDPDAKTAVINEVQVHTGQKLWTPIPAPKSGLITAMKGPKRGRRRVPNRNK
jgi:hypothetical protein